MRIKYDGVADAATIYLVAETPAGGSERSFMTDLEVQQGAVILLLSEDQRLIGIEVLGASKILPLSLLQSAGIAEDPLRD